MRRSDVHDLAKQHLAVQRQDRRIAILHALEREEAPRITVLWVLGVGLREGLDAGYHASCMDCTPQLSLVLLRRQAAYPSFKRVFRH